jgi:hypothetical protein
VTLLCPRKLARGSTYRHAHARTGDHALDGLTRVHHLGMLSKARLAHTSRREGGMRPTSQLAKSLEKTRYAFSDRRDWQYGLKRPMVIAGHPPGVIIPPGLVIVLKRVPRFPDLCPTPWFLPIRPLLFQDKSHQSRRLGRQLATTTQHKPATLEGVEERGPNSCRAATAASAT